MKTNLAALCLMLFGSSTLVSGAGDAQTNTKAKPNSRPRAKVAQPADVFGWGKTRWGMTRVEVEKLYPGNDWHDVDAEYREHIQGRETLPDSFVVAGNKCTLDLYYRNSGTHGLMRVRLYFRLGYEGVLEELEKKYGEPDVEDADETAQSWSFKHTVIHTSREAEVGFFVTYEIPERKPDKGDL